MKTLPRYVLVFFAGVCAFILVCLRGPACAIERDTQLWNTTNFNYSIDDQWSMNMEVQERWYGDVSYFSSLFLRPSISYKWNDWLTLTAGYAHVWRWSEDGDIPDENRIWEQVGIRLFGGMEKPSLNWRTRLEQRFFDDVSEPTWRLREQMRFMAPLIKHVQGVIWSEAFWRLNTTESTKETFETGIEQWRNFVGLNIEITKNMTFEAGYMNVYTWRNRADTDEDVVWLITTFKM